ncbi:DNA replication complex GINS protein PSF2-like [Argonauta hians]
MSGKAVHMSPAEIEFLAEKELISFEPNFTYSNIYLIQGDFGPFEAGIPTSVPLWLAINLKQRCRGRIIPPSWMNLDDLNMKKQEEIESKFFTKMPSEYYIEITQLLLKCAPEDIPKADDLRTLIKDIWDLRKAKLRSSIDTFIKSDATHAKLNHLTPMEINTIRAILTETMNHINILRNNIHTKYTADSQAE